MPTNSSTARNILGTGQFFRALLADIGRAGLVGEESNALILYIVAVSRLFARPINLFVKGRSASGKNHLVRTVLRLFPKHCIKEITNSSELAFSYLGGRLRHKIVYLQEETIAFGGKAHPARMLISEGKLIRIITQKKDGKYRVKRQVTEGPVSCISTTTQNQLKIDDETRHVSIRVDESPAQTARIIRSQMTQQQLSQEQVQTWHEVQRLLSERAIAPIELPNWFSKVADHVCTDNVRVRRDFPAFIEACKVVCLIRSFRKHETNPEGLVVTFSDFAITALIFNPAFSQNLGNSFDDALLRVMNGAAKDRAQGASAVEVAQRLNIPLHKAYQRLRKAAEAGAIRHANGPEKANRKRYLAVARPQSFLPGPQDIFNLIARPGARVSFIHPVTGKAILYEKS